jgi:hypothetical protein
MNRNCAALSLPGRSVEGAGGSWFKGFEGFGGLIEVEPSTSSLFRFNEESFGFLESDEGLSGLAGGVGVGEGTEDGLLRPCRRFHRQLTPQSEAAMVSDPPWLIVGAAWPIA